MLLSSNKYFSSNTKISQMARKSEDFSSSIYLKLDLAFHAAIDLNM